MEYMPILFFIAFFGTVSVDPVSDSDDGGDGGDVDTDPFSIDAELDAGFDSEFDILNITIIY
tara:strand:- start:579 stop:764 length:186 start_codon:yes stop_codon:yes gene_type:complete